MLVLYVIAKEEKSWPCAGQISPYPSYGHLSKAEENKKSPENKNEVNPHQIQHHAWFMSAACKVFWSRGPEWHERRNKMLTFLRGYSVHRFFATIITEHQLKDAELALSYQLYIFNTFA